MKRHILTLGLIPALTLGLAVGCGSEEPAGGDEEAIEGTYEAVSEANERGYVSAEVTFEDGDIVEVELAEFTDFDQTKGDDYSYDEWHEAMDELPERFVDANSADIDVFTGATSTSEKAMDAVEKATMIAEGDVEQFDGTFLGTSEENDRGNWGVAWVTVEDGDIAEVELEEVQETDEGHEFKGEEYDHDEYLEAQEEMPERFVETNSSEVDAFSEATGSAERWMEAVETAVNRSIVE